jgi:ubiquinone/menaquinone biosynthesis C-methylase UbiE
MTDLNPQMKQMADASMVRTLDAQARAIWPQESVLFARYGLQGDIRVLDAGCGTGEISYRIAEMYPQAQVLGIDVLDGSLDVARSRSDPLASRLTFANQSVYELPAADGTYDLVVNRHVLHSIPFPQRVLAELKRVIKRGGWLHVIPEDYGMLQFERRPIDAEEFWHFGSAEFAQKTNTDLNVGRHTYGMLVDLGFTDITVDYVIVDTLRVPRETFAAIIEAWRDGYVDVIGEYTRFTSEQAKAHFDEMLANIRDPRRYAVWFVPVLGARVP